MRSIVFLAFFLAGLVAAVPQCCCCHMEIPALVCKLGQPCICSLIACPADVPTIYEGPDGKNTTKYATTSTTGATSSSMDGSSSTTPTSSGTDDSSSATDAPTSSSTFTPVMPGSPPGLSSSSSTQSSTSVGESDYVQCCCCDTGARVYRCGMMPRNACYCQNVVCPESYRMVWDP